MLGYVIAAAVAGVVAAGYNTMAPRSQLYGQTFIGRRGSRQLALTFDDGPNDPHTLKLLEVLARHGVRATFFVLGRFVVERPAIVREIARAGHALGNHTYSHPNLIFATRRQIESQICDCEQAISDALGEMWVPRPLRSEAEQGVGTSSFDARLFRPPYGGRTPGVLRAVRQMGYVPVMWSASAWDWKAKAPEQIERTVARQVRGGEIILLHDGGHERLGVDRSASVVVADRIIAHYKSQGYEFVTVPEMIEALNH